MDLFGGRQAWKRWDESAEGWVEFVLLQCKCLVTIHGMEGRARRDYVTPIYLKSLLKQRTLTLITQSHSYSRGGLYFLTGFFLLFPKKRRHIARGRKNPLKVN